MELLLKPECVDRFERRMESLAPWMHPYKFSDDIYAGYFEYVEGLGRTVTYVHRDSPRADSALMKKAYALYGDCASHRFFSQIMNVVCPDEALRKSMRVLDIASASGEKSLWAVDEGFGRVISSEIRQNQSEQCSLILESIRDERYRRSITVVHDPVSADSASFPDRYVREGLDLVMSFGLLYHLANPIQHIRNLNVLTNKYAVIYTLTHADPRARRMWSPVMEDGSWITKAVSSIGWCPHYHEVKRLCLEAGFRKVTILYPDMFVKHFPYYRDERAYAYARVWLAQRLYACCGIRVGMMKNHDYARFPTDNLHPDFYAYVCEK